MLFETVLKKRFLASVMTRKIFVKAANFKETLAVQEGVDDGLAPIHTINSSPAKAVDHIGIGQVQAGHPLQGFRGHHVIDIGHQHPGRLSHVEAQIASPRHIPRNIFLYAIDAAGREREPVDGALGTIIDQHILYGPPMKPPGVQMQRQHVSLIIVGMEEGNHGMTLSLSFENCSSCAVHRSSFIGCSSAQNMPTFMQRTQNSASLRKRLRGASPSALQAQPLRLAGNSVKHPYITYCNILIPQGDLSGKRMNHLLTNLWRNRHALIYSSETNPWCNIIASE
jgi:hypothetical protein